MGDKNMGEGLWVKKAAWTCRSNAAQAAQLHTVEIQRIPVGKWVHLAELELASDCGKVENSANVLPATASDSCTVCFPWSLNLGGFGLGISAATADRE